MAGGQIPKLRVPFRVRGAAHYTPLAQVKRHATRYKQALPHDKREVLHDLAKSCIAILQVANDPSLPDPNRQQTAKVEAAKQMLQNTMQLLAYEEFAANKQDNKMGFEAKALQPGYSNERADYMRQKGGEKGTTNEIQVGGAGFIHDQLDMKRGGNRPAVIDETPGEIVAILDKAFQAITPQDYFALHGHFDKKGGQASNWMSDNSAHENRKNVFFARKKERLQELMLIPFEGKLYTTKGELFNSDQAAYAIDKYGNIMVKDISQGVPGQDAPEEDAQFNHSTLVAGARVTCAGELACVNGELTKISSASGHYRPTNGMLSNALSHLMDCGLPVHETLTEVDCMASGDVFVPAGDTSAVQQAFDNAPPSINPMPEAANAVE